MDAKRIIIFVVLLVALVFAGKRACKYWKLYHGGGTPPPATTTPAPGTTPAGP